ncbi:MAG: hypothetical protein ACOCOW_05290 [Prevotella sp.]
MKQHIQSTENIRCAGFPLFSVKHAANGKRQMALALDAAQRVFLVLVKKIKSTGGCRVRPAMNNLIAQQKRTERYERGRGEANLLGGSSVQGYPFAGTVLRTHGNMC